jgi:hypothetical protein
VRHQGADWGLIDFAKQAFGAQNASEIGFNFIETNAAAEEVPPTRPPAEVAVVEQKSPPL